MTIQSLERAIAEQGLRGSMKDFDTTAGECRFEVSDAEGHNRVVIRFPYSELENPGLPQIVGELYFRELGRRRAERLGSKKKI